MQNWVWFHFLNPIMDSVEKGGIQKVQISGFLVLPNPYV